MDMVVECPQTVLPGLLFIGLHMERRVKVSLEMFRREGNEEGRSDVGDHHQLAQD
jgi:hypothetical protein